MCVCACMCGSCVCVSVYVSACIACVLVYFIYLCLQVKCNVWHMLQVYFHVQKPLHKHISSTMSPVTVFPGLQLPPMLHFPRIGTTTAQVGIHERSQTTYHRHNIFALIMFLHLPVHTQSHQIHATSRILFQSHLLKPQISPLCHHLLPL